MKRTNTRMNKSTASSKKKVKADHIEVPLSDLKPNKWSRRRRVTDSFLKREISSLEKKKKYDPLIIRKTKNSSFEIVTGEVRWQAAKKIGLHSILCQVKALSESDARKLFLLERLDQPGVSPLDEADILSELMQAYSLRQSELATLTNRSKTQISRTIRISTMSNDMKEKVRSHQGVITRAQLIEAAEHPHLAEWIIDEQPTLREVRSRLSHQSEPDRPSLPSNNKRRGRAKRKSSSACVLNYDEFEDGRGFRLKVHFDQTSCGREKKDEIIHTLKVALFLLGEIDLEHAVKNNNNSVAHRPKLSPNG